MMWIASTCSVTFTNPEHMQTTNKTENPEETPLTPEEVKAIGEIELGPAKHEVFLNKHYKKLIFGGVALAVVASIATAWYAYGEQQKKEAGAQIVSAFAPRTNINDADPLSIVLEDYPDTPSAETATYIKAARDLSDPAFTDFSVMQQLADNAESESVRLLACHALAARYAKDGDYDNATLYLKKVINFPRNVYTAHAYICLSDIAWNKGDKQQALMYLTEGRETCPDSPLFSEAGGTGGAFAPYYQILRNQVSVRFDMLESGVDAPVDPIFATPIETTDVTVPTVTGDVAVPAEGAAEAPVAPLPPNPATELPAMPSSTLEGVTPAPVGI